MRVRALSIAIATSQVCIIDKNFEKNGTSEHLPKPARRLQQSTDNMAVSEPVALLTSLTESLESATTALTDHADRFLPPQDGISLLDVKNDLILTYLQNLAFLILFKIREGKSEHINGDATLYGSAVEKLAELRVYLERGVRPIEQRLKYTIDQYLQAANHKKTTQATRTSTGHVKDPDASDSDSDASDDNDTSAPFPPAEDEPIHAPRLATSIPSSNKPNNSTSQPTSTSTSSGLYRPPRLNPTSMPSSDPDSRTRQPRQRKSHLLNEYINEELSSAPSAQPSIGSNHTITASRSGRSTHLTTQSARDVTRMRERTDYEETNFTRLPGESKQEKRDKKRREAQDGAREMFGGEDWTGLGGLGDRIGKSVDGGARREKEGALKRREKRRATEDMPRGDGMQIGDSFAKKQKVLAGRAERKGMKKRR